MKSSEKAPALNETHSIDWRAIAKNGNKVSPELAEMMDNLVSVLSPQEIEEKYQEILKVQEEGNKRMKTNVQPREGFMVSAIIQLGKERGLLTDQEARELSLKVWY